jgi:prolyl oligopeptidase
MKDGARAATLLCFLLAPGGCLGAKDAIPTPPPTRQDNVREVLHGVEIVDPYRWLEDQASPETRAWIEAQNRYTHGVLDGAPWRGAIRDRLSALSRYDVQGLPLARGGRYFFRKRRVQDDLAILYARQGLGSPDEVLLDPHPLSPDRTTDVSLEDVSGDGRVLV